jgi:hypothetical protein
MKLRPSEEKGEVDVIPVSLASIAGTCDADEQTRVAEHLSLIFSGAPALVAYRIENRQDFEEIIGAMHKVADRLWPRKEGAT